MFMVNAGRYSSPMEHLGDSFASWRSFTPIQELTNGCLRGFQDEILPINYIGL